MDVDSYHWDVRFPIMEQSHWDLWKRTGLRMAAFCGATGMSAPSLYACLKGNRLPTNALAAEAYTRILGIQSGVVQPGSSEVTP